jgi:hypothetical protein
MTDPAQPFVLVARMRSGRWERVVLAPDEERLLVFDESRLALTFATGITEAGVDSARLASLDGGDDALAEVLDRHDAAPPCSFENECLAKYERDDERMIAAYVYGLVTGGQLLDAYHLAAPN